VALFLATAIPFVFQQTAVAQAPFAFVENGNQWPENVIARTDIDGGRIFLEKDKLTVHLMQSNEEAHSDFPHSFPNKHHVYHINFVGALSPTVVKELPSRTKYNFLLGNDKSQWSSNLSAFGVITLKNLYPNIDFKLYTKNGQLKYDFIVHPGGDASLIKLRYDFVDDVQLNNYSHKLEILTSLGTTIESRPLYTISGTDGDIKGEYIVQNNIVSFQIPEYNNTLKTLVIDPILEFASYTGSTANNFGYTAAPDNEGYLYSGSSVFAQGYPTTTGAFDQTYNDAGASLVDIGLSKWDTDGSKMIWSTYVGGNQSEFPHSLIVNDNHELYFLGTTSSLNFPLGPSPYQSTFGGGSVVDLRGGLGAIYNNGSDIVIGKLSADGSTMLGGTYYGGSGNDGLNANVGATNPLKYNYADEVRGEIILDENDNVYIASCTFSKNLPITANAVQKVKNDKPGVTATDGLVAKFDGNLSALLYGTYYGGDGYDSFYSLKLSSNGDLVAVGGTNSQWSFEGYPFPAINAYQGTYGGGKSDGAYLVLDPSLTTVVSSSYYGTASYDQIYFTDINKAGEIHFTGQTETNTGFYSTGQPYDNAKSGQFISKFNDTGTNRMWSTCFGTGGSRPNIAPSAFLVDVCNKIFVAGWGGGPNTNPGLVSNNATTVSGMPITADAFQSTTDGADFYIIVLEADAQALFYGSYFGGKTSQEHVDGGTSRFDKRGKIYQAVCAGCGGFNDFPTTPGVVSNTNNSGNGCNLGVFKFDFLLENTVADFTLPKLICDNGGSTFQVTPTDKSLQATTYRWNFGDGSPIVTSSNPTHTYTAPGVYTVTLIVENPASCNLIDSAKQDIVLLQSGDIGGDTLSLCIGQQAQIGLNPLPSTGVSYKWTPATDLSNANISNPIATATATRNYNLEITAGNCVSNYATRIVVPNNTALFPDSTVCLNTNLTLKNTSGLAATNVQWFSDPAKTININSRVGEADVLITSNTTFYITYVLDGCPQETSVEIRVVLDDVTADFSMQDIWCYKQDFFPKNNSTNATSYRWTTSEPDVSTAFEPRFSFPTAGIYTVKLVAFKTIGTCTYTDSLVKSVQVFIGGIQSTTDIDACPNKDVTIGINKSDSVGPIYTWYPPGFPSPGAAVNRIVNVTDSATFRLEGRINSGCTIEYIFNVNVPNPPKVLPDSLSYCTGETEVLIATPPAGSTNFQWRLNGSNLGNTPSIAVTPTGTQVYEFFFDFNGCRFSNAIVVYPGGFDVTVSFTVDTLACQDQVVNFSSSATPGATLQWTFGDATTSTVANPTHTYINPGDYNVVLTATKSSASCTNTATVSKTIHILNNNIKQEVNLSLCKGDVVQLGIPQDSLDLTYFWTPIDGLSNPTVIRPFITADTSIRYLFIAQKDVLCADTTAFNIDIPTNQEIVQPDTLVCPNTDILLTPTTVPQGIGYQWYADKALTKPLSSGPGFTLTVNVNTAKTFYISYNYRNCPVVDSIRVTPKVLNIVANFSFDNVVCKEGDVAFTNTSINVNTYDWNFDDGNTSTDVNPTNVFTADGVYNVRLIGEGTDQGCTTKDTVIKQLLVLGDSRINYQNLKACVGDFVQLGVAPVMDPTVSFRWIPTTDLSDPNISNPTTIAKDTIIYELIIETGSCKDTLVTTLNVPQIPEILQPNYTICLGDSIIIGPDINFDGGTFTWYTDKDYTTEEPTTLDTLRLLFTKDTTFYYSYKYEGCPKQDSIKIAVVGRDVLSDFTYPRIGCSFGNITFTQTGTATSTTTWDFGDGTTSSQLNPTHSYASVGDFDVQLIILVPRGTCMISDTTVKTISIYGNGNRLGRETQYCKGDSAEIGDAFTFPNPIDFEWQPTSNLNTDTLLKVKTFATDSTNYILIISDTLGTCADTIRYPVHVPKSPSTQLPSQEFCKGDVITLDVSATQSIQNVKWYNSPVFISPLNPSNRTFITVSPVTEQRYYIGFNYAGCPFKDSTLLIPLQVAVNLNKPNFACYNDEVILNAVGTPTTVNYTWATNATEIADASLPASSIKLRAEQNENVSVTVTNHIGCTASKTVLLDVSKLTPLAHTIDFIDTLYVKGDTADIAVIPAPPTYVYVWEPQEIFRPYDAAKTQFQATDNDTVYVTISDGFCNLNLKQRVRVLDNPCGPPDIFVPNAFSPNGDNNNDVLRVRGQYIKAMLFRVYDRWGQKVYETRDQSKGWDGTFKGQQLDPAVFVYYLEAECIFGKQYKTKGNVTLLR